MGFLSITPVYRHKIQEGNSLLPLRISTRRISPPLKFSKMLPQQPSMGREEQTELSLSPQKEGIMRANQPCLIILWPAWLNPHVYGIWLQELKMRRYTMHTGSIQGLIKIGRA